MEAELEAVTGMSFCNTPLKSPDHLLGIELDLSSERERKFPRTF